MPELFERAQDDFETGELLAVLVAVIVIGYGLYKGFGALGTGLSALWKSGASSITGVFKAENQIATQTAGSVIVPDIILPCCYQLPCGTTVGDLRAAGDSDTEIADIIAIGMSN